MSECSLGAGLGVDGGDGKAMERVRLWVGAKCTFLTDGARDELGVLAVDDWVCLRAL